MSGQDAAKERGGQLVTVAKRSCSFVHVAVKPLWEVSFLLPAPFDQTPKASIMAEPPLIGLGCSLPSPAWEF